MAKRDYYEVLGVNRDADEKELIKQAFPRHLVEHALASGFFGGELNIKKMNLLQKSTDRHFVAPISRSASMASWVGKTRSRSSAPQSTEEATFTGG